MITSGCGGAILTRNKQIADKAKYYTSQARDKDFDYIHNDVGYNFRLSNLNAAVGLAQLEKITQKLNKKKLLIVFIKKNKQQNFYISKSPEYGKNNFWINILRFNEKKKLQEKNYLIYLEKNIEIRPVWYPIHLLKPYRKYERFEIYKATKLLNSSICLPSSSNLKIKDLNRVVKVINNL